MRIALLHYSFAPILGGVEIVMAAHARIFREAGHEVFVVCQRGDESDPAVRILPDGAGMPGLAAALEGADLAIVHNVLTMPFDPGLTALLWQMAAAEGKLQFVSWIHDIAALNPDYAFDREAEPWRLLSQASPDFDYVAVSDHRAGQFAALTGVAPRVIPNGVEPAAVLGLTAPVRAFMDRHDLWSREMRLFQPARFVRRKNIELSLDVTAALRDAGRDAALLVTGAADAQNAAGETHLAELRDQRRRLGLEGRAFFLSETFAVTSADLAALYGLADALFFPSRHEGFGLPLLEAALHRIPIFCLDAPPMNSLLDSRVHCFSAAATPSEIASLAVSVLDRNPAHQARRDVFSRYTWRAIADRHLKPFLHDQTARL